MWIITIKDEEGCYDIEIKTLEHLNNLYWHKKRNRFNIVDTVKRG